MKTNNSSSLVCRIEKKDFILSPKNRFIDHVAVLDELILGCGGGKLYQRTRGKWNTGCQSDSLFKMDGLKQNVSVFGNKAVLLNGNDSCPGELFVYDSETKDQRKVPLKFGSGSSTVLGGAKNGKDLFYISNHEEKVVHQLNHEGQLIQNVGEELLCYPYSMASDPFGDVIVSDWLLNDVIIFEPGGNVKRRLCKNNGFSPENGFHPYGVATDKKGFIFVSSWRENKIFLFSPHGDFMQTLLTRDSGLDGPTNLTTKDNHLIIVNCHGTQICRYGYKISERKKIDETQQKVTAEA